MTPPHKAPHSELQWRKSSYSNHNGGDCIEVADGISGTVPVRDSKDPMGPALVFEISSFKGFIRYVRSSAFDR